MTTGKAKIILQWPLCMDTQMEVCLQISPVQKNGGTHFFRPFWKSDVFEALFVYPKNHQNTTLLAITCACKLPAFFKLAEL